MAYSLQSVGTRGFALLSSGRGTSISENADQGLFLPSYPTLEVTDERGAFYGKVLADLVADVVNVEPPDGNKLRRPGPFVGDEPFKSNS